MKRPRLLIEEWLPARAIGVECMRERSTGQQPPDKRLHVWWARRPLAISRAAVLGSLLPADFDHARFERLLGFGIPGDELVSIRALMDTGERVPGGFGCGRAFSNPVPEDDRRRADETAHRLWNGSPVVLDPMSGGGSIPLESARLGFETHANELNPVACSVLEATVDYPLRFGTALAGKARRWGKVWEEKAAARLAPYYPRQGFASVHAYIFARTVPCPDTGFPTPLVPDWSLLRKAGSPHLAAEPIVSPPSPPSFSGKGAGGLGSQATGGSGQPGTWTVRVIEVGRGAGQRPLSQPTYKGGDGISLFTGKVIPSDYIKAKAQQGQLGSALYAVALKTDRLTFRPAEAADLAALAAAEEELARLRPAWERDGIIPTEAIPRGEKTREPLNVGHTTWASLFSPRQLLAMGTLVEELRRLRPEIVAAEGEEMGEAVVHLLALGLDKFANYNSVMASWHAPRQVMRSVFDRHDFAFKATHAELATCVAGSGLAWALENVIEAYEKLAELPRAPQARPAAITQGSATTLSLEDGSVTAVVVDPPYADNVQYSELADFFYVWLKRTQGHRRPEWFATYLCDHTQEAVVNASRFQAEATAKGEAKALANAFYQDLMRQTFTEARRVLRDDGVLTVMFTHKKQEAWAALFQSLIDAGFTVTATWPVQTESQHSLHQAKKNAAQSTVLLVARKRDPSAGRGTLDQVMLSDIRLAARAKAAQLKEQGLNPVDQLVGAFGPAMEVFSRYAQVRTDTGEPVGVEEAIQAAADAVAEWRAEQSAPRGLDGVDHESKFIHLCWDVLGAAQFRFNEAMLLGRSVGMDVTTLVAAGLVSKTGENITMLPAKERRRDQPIRDHSQQLELPTGGGRKRRVQTKRKVHPSDVAFASAIDACHALALRHADAGGGDAGIGSARQLALQQRWTRESPVAKLMAALVEAAPAAVRFPGKGRQRTAADDFPEFRAWHALLKPLFGLEASAWVAPKPLQPRLKQLEVVEEDEFEEDEEGKE